MGTERLRLRGGAGLVRAGGAALALAVLLLLLWGCGRAETTVTTSPRALTVRRHLQVVRAMTMAERTGIVMRFRARNPGPPWAFNEDALDGVVVVDPFRRFLRRGQQTHAIAPGARGVSPEEAALAARAFVEKNADLLGLPVAIVHALAEDRSSAGDRWRIRFTASYPSRGYEAFREVDNEVDLEVLVASDGMVTAFVNRSRLHPLLLLDVHPDLASDDPSLLRQLVGRPIYAAAAPLGVSDTRPASRVQVGVVRARDITKIDLTVYPSPGPQLAYVTYRLAYLVIGVRPLFPGGPDPSFDPGIATYGFVIDADTGEVLAENLRDLPRAEEEEP